MRIRPGLALFLIGLLTAAACGDNDGSGCSGTGAATSGTGGGGQGGAGNTLAPDGAPCERDAECAGGECWTEVGWGWPSGYCAGTCGEGIDCVGGGVCILNDGTMCSWGTCFDPCAQTTDCRDGYACAEADYGNVCNSGAMVCLPVCTADAQCPTVGACDVAQGLCFASEAACDDGYDNDHDGAYDCEDPHCATPCAPLLEAACAGAVAAQATNNGDTVNGTSLFAGSCVGAHRKEQVYTFTPGAAGEVGALTITLQSAQELGMYVRTSCGNASTEIACRASSFGGIDEVLTLVVNGGEPITIFIDSAFNAALYTMNVSFPAWPDDGGPYTLNASFTPAGAPAAAP